MYVGPTGSTAFGKRYKFPGGSAQQAPAQGRTTPYVGPTGSPSFGTRWQWPAAPAAVNGGSPAAAPSGGSPDAAPAGSTEAAASTDPVAPFMTGQDIVNYGDAFKSHEDQIAQADKDLGDIKAQAQTALYNIGRNYLTGTNNEQNDAAARGIFQSSIKDGALADLAATKASLTSDVTTRVNNAQLFHDNAVQRINDWWNNFQEGMNTIKVQNAAAVPATPAAPAAAAPATQPAAARPAPRFGYVSPTTQFVRRNAFGQPISIFGSRPHG